ncbi:MAG: hypothetical protein QOG59_2028 [Solirubrobacteraceae bacterium]|nr:hypothetical protein [Solirubrobacteraceae bacterium]
MTRRLRARRRRARPPGGEVEHQSGTGVRERCGQTAAVRDSDRVGDRQPPPPPSPAGPSAASQVGHRGRQTRAVVADLEAHRLTDTARPQRDRPAAVLDGVGEQVAQRLSDPDPRAPDRTVLPHPLGYELHTRCERPRGRRADGLLEQATSAQALQVAAGSGLGRSPRPAPRPSIPASQQVIQGQAGPVELELDRAPLLDAPGLAAALQRHPEPDGVQGPAQLVRRSDHSLEALGALTQEPEHDAGGDERHRPSPEAEQRAGHRASPSSSRKPTPHALMTKRSPCTPSLCRSRNAWESSVRVGARSR